MNFKALITTLVIGSSSVALADPSWTRSADRAEHVTTVDHSIVRDPIPTVDNCDNVQLGADASTYIGPDSPVWVRGWRPLTVPTMLGRGNEIIPVATNRIFHQVKLQPSSGRTAINAITVVFKNGSREVIRVGQNLDARNKSLTIAIQRQRPIAEIIVSGHSALGARYTVLAA
jgi:hypothetical protein